MTESGKRTGRPPNSRKPILPEALPPDTGSNAGIAFGGPWPKVRIRLTREDVYSRKTDPSFGNFGVLK